MDETKDKTEGEVANSGGTCNTAEVSAEDRRQLLEKIRSRVSSAPIKEEFIDFQRFHQLYGDQNNKQDKATKDQEPPRKKQKKSGQNKKRPRPKRSPPHERLCLNFSMGRVCEYGEKCKFSHDIAEMMKNKLPDIGPKCYNFDTFGRCPFGLMCRYGVSHISPDFENVTDESRRVDPASLTSNQLTVELKKALRKKMGAYPRSEAYLQKLPRQGRGKKKGAMDASIRGSDCTKSNPVDKVEGVSDAGAPGGVVRTNMDRKDTSTTGVTITQPELPQNSENESSMVGSSVINGGIPLDSVPAAQSETDPPDGSAINKPDHTVSLLPTGKVMPGTDGAIAEAPVIADAKMSSPKDTKMSSPLTEPPQEVQSTVTRGAVDPGERGLVDTSSPETLNGPREKKSLDVDGKLLLAPLTTVGNLPFRRICKRYGADITCGEMAMCTNLLMGQACEWALLRRHHTEDVFGVQLCGAFPDTMTKCAELLSSKLELDFIDVNVGCPIDLVYHKGAGSGLMNRMTKFEQIVRGMSSVMDIPLTVKLRTGVLENKNTAHTVIPKLYDWGASVVTVHGRSREARYTRSADWEYLKTCAEVAQPYPFIGNGDILSFEDANEHFKSSGSAGLMIARGALIKPWIFTEIKEQRHWDISSGERLDLLRDFSNYGLEHWGSDSQGVEKTRRFLLEWLSFLHRYIPVGLLERVPQRINERPPYYLGRDDLETMMASANCDDWVKISEMLLGPVPSDFIFLPKHKANSYK